MSQLSLIRTVFLMIHAYLLKVAQPYTERSWIVVTLLATLAHEVVTLSVW